MLKCYGKRTAIQVISVISPKYLFNQYVRCLTCSFYLKREVDLSTLLEKTQIEASETKDRLQRRITVIMITILHGKYYSEILYRMSKIQSFVQILVKYKYSS